VSSDCGLQTTNTNAISVLLVRNKGQKQKGNLRRCGGRDGRHAFKDDDTIGEVSCHDEVVLDDKGRFLGVENEALDHLCGDDALLRVQEAEIRSVRVSFDHQGS
jgi:hypothetical protein